MLFELCVHNISASYSRIFVRVSLQQLELWLFTYRFRFNKKGLTPSTAVNGGNNTGSETEDQVKKVSRRLQYFINLKEGESALSSVSLPLSLGVFSKRKDFIIQ